LSSAASSLADFLIEFESTVNKHAPLKKMTRKEQKLRKNLS